MFSLWSFTNKILLRVFFSKIPGFRSPGVVDHADHTITTASVPNKIIAKSRFFIHVKSGLIAFNALADIPKAVFFNRFVEIFKESYQNFMVEAVIYSIDEEYKFYETIKTFNTIEKIKSTHPSNPRFRHKWKDIDERMKRWNVANYSESFQTNPREMGALT